MSQQATTAPGCLRVMHVIANLDPRHGGPSGMLPDMCRALANRGHSIEIVATDAYGSGRWRTSPRPPEAGQLSVQYFPAQWPRRFEASWPMIPWLGRAIPGFDLVHIHSLYLFHTSVAAYWCRHYGVPYIMRPHGTLDPYLRRKSRTRKAVYDRLFERRNLDCAAAIHYTSQGELDLVRPLGLASPGIVAPLGVDIAQFSTPRRRGAFRKRHPHLAEKQLVVFLGRLTPKKGLDLLAQAFARVASRFPDAHLVIAGPDDEGYGPQVRAFLSQAGVEQRTTMTGMLVGEDKMALLADTDVWVLPSYTENFGVAVVEALARGLPIVISDKVNICSRIAAARAGLVTACDAEAFAEAVCQVLSDAALGRGLGRAGRKLARSEFSWEAAAEKLEAAYYRTLAAWPHRHMCHAETGARSPRRARNDNRLRFETRS